MNPSKLRVRAAMGLAAATLAACFVPVGHAGGATAGREKVRPTAAGKAAAKAAVLKRTDLGPLPGWTGGSTKPNLSSSGCVSWRPKQSDLVLIGAAETQWKRPGLVLDSEAQVLATPRMVDLDWNRTMQPQLLTCLRTLSAKARNGERLVSVRWLAFPRVVPHTRALRLVVDLKTTTGTVRLMEDLVAIGRSRTEVTLSTTAPLADAATLRPVEIRTARLLASRVRM